MEPEVVWSPSRGPGVVRRPVQRAWSGREAIPEGREWLGGLPEVWEWSEGNPVGPEVVGKPSRRVRRPYWRAGSGQGSLLEGWEWSGGPPRKPEVVRRPSQRVGRPTGGPGVVGSPS